MDWLISAFWARIGWAFGELALMASLIAAIALVFIAVSVPRLLRQKRCRHMRYRETSSCDAICNDCGKNLGFIGCVRDAKDTA